MKIIPLALFVAVFAVVYVTAQDAPADNTSDKKIADTMKAGVDAFKEGLDKLSTSFKSMADKAKEMITKMSAENRSKRALGDNNSDNYQIPYY